MYEPDAQAREPAHKPDAQARESAVLALARASGL
jgi:hypothetical protein